MSIDSNLELITTAFTHKLSRQAEINTSLPDNTIRQSGTSGKIGVSSGCMVVGTPRKSWEAKSPPLNPCNHGSLVPEALDCQSVEKPGDARKRALLVLYWLEEWSGSFMPSKQPFYL